MQFRFAHNNFNVRDLERSLKFYDEALGLKEVRRIGAKDGSFTIVYLSDGSTPHQLELTALSVDDFGAAHHRHQQMGCICFENPAMGIYFISDPDGYWVEIIPSKM